MSSVKLKNTVGIVGYGVALPSTVITAEEIGKAHGGDGKQGHQLGVKQKTVAAIDEDAITLATQAGFHAVQGKQERVEAVFIGSESHPYAVKPSGTVVKTALGLGERMALADLQFACKAGTQAMQIILNYVAAGTAEYGLAIGADTAQSKPGDVLEFTAGAGAAAYLLGSNEKEIIANCVGTLSIATDTPDFWRRPGQPYPEHAGRFSGEPGYFYHVKKAATMLMDELRLKPSDFAHCVFHTPNAKFPQTVAKQLGFTEEQLAPALIVKDIGNTYAAASLLALAAVLDQAKPNQKIVVASYGSGAGSDAFVFETTEHITAYQRKQSVKLKDLTQQMLAVSYQEYQRSSVGRE